MNGQLVNDYTEEQMMKVRADIGMVFQEGALFDSLTVAENVGYKLYEETEQPLDSIKKRVEEVLDFVRLSDFFYRMPLEALRGPAAPVGPSLPRWAGKPGFLAVRRTGRSGSNLLSVKKIRKKKSRNVARFPKRVPFLSWGEVTSCAKLDFFFLDLKETSPD